MLDGSTNVLAVVVLRVIRAAALQVVGDDGDVIQVICLLNDRASTDVRGVAGAIGLALSAVAERHRDLRVSTLQGVLEHALGANSLDVVHRQHSTVLVHDRPKLVAGR